MPIDWGKRLCSRTMDRREEFCEPAQSLHHFHDFILTINAVSDVHAMTALWSILLMCIGLMGIIYRIEEQY